MMMQDISIHQDNSLRVNFSALDDDGLQVDLSAAKNLLWQVKSSKESVSIIEKTEADFTFVNGDGYIDINSTESSATAGKYQHELRMVTYDDEVYTVVQGMFTILKTII